MSKAQCGWALGMLLLNPTVFAAIPAPNVNTVPPPYASDTEGLYPVYDPMPQRSFHSSNVRLHAQPGCVRLKFDVGAEGTTKNVSVWSDYPSDLLNQIAVDGLTQWRFHPRVKDGKAIATSGLFVEFVYPTTAYNLLQWMRGFANRPNVFDILLSQADASYWNANSGHGYVRHDKPDTAHSRSYIPVVWQVADTSLIWLCKQAPMHGVTIVMRTSISADRTTDPYWNEADPTVYVPMRLLPQNVSSGRVLIRFCVDPEGRASDTVIEGSSPSGVYDEVARLALDQVKFSSRWVHAATVWTCGITVPVSFFGMAAREGNIIGKIGSLKFRSLSGHPPTPKLKEEKPVKLSLSIPAGTKLPPVAKVELRFCIEKDGSVSNPTVVKADPPKLFDRAALETVAGWRFARPSAGMCDIYEWVRFPLSGD